MKTKLTLLACLLINFATSNASVTHRLTHTNDSTYLLAADASYTRNDFEYPITYDATKTKKLILTGEFTASDLGLMIYFNKAFFSCFNTIDMTDCKLTAIITSYHPERYQGGTQVSATFADNFLPNYCFYYNTNLKNLILPKTCNTVSSICANPTSLKTLTVTNTSAIVWSKPYLSDSLFLITEKETAYKTRLANKDSVVLYVPKQYVKTYKGYVGWRSVKIVGYDTSTTPLDEISEKPTIKIYPTIAKDKINITGVEYGTVSIIDLNGNIVYKEGVSHQINIESLTQGFYIVLIDNQMVGKIIKL
jgi:hypothetical protein